MRIAKMEVDCKRRKTRKRKGKCWTPGCIRSLAKGGEKKGGGASAGRGGGTDSGPGVDMRGGFSE